MDYNTQREQLRLPEYGRCVQEMVKHAMTLDDKSERQRCAFTIIDIMAGMQTYTGSPDDFFQKLWNHLAYISNYKLDIDYPVEIQHIDKQESHRDRVEYPQTKISRRHYGHIIEQLTRHLTDMEPGPERTKLIELVANQMKRALASWNSNALDDEKILSDLAEYTNGKISLLPDEIRLMSNKEAIASAMQSNMSTGKKKKKK